MKNKKKKTVVLVKPDGVMKKAVGAIRERYTAVGLSVKSEHRFRFTEDQARRFYAAHEGRHFFEGLVLAMCAGEVVAWLLEGEDAIETVRKLNGATDPRQAEAGTIRKDFLSAGGPFNTVHGSASEEEAEKEWDIVLESTAGWD